MSVNMIFIKRLVYVMIFCVVITITWYFVAISAIDWKRPFVENTDVVKLQDFTDEVTETQSKSPLMNLVELQRLTDEEVQILNNRSLIFFHETSNDISNKSQVSITARKACSVESAAIHNPNSTVYLLYATLLKYENDTIFFNTSEEIFEQLLSYENIRIRRADIRSYAKGSPLQEWVSTGQLEKSDFLYSHFSDVMRYLTLWKFGGTYLDLDVVVTKNLEGLGENYAVAELDIHVAAGLLNFDAHGTGHSIMDRCINEIRTNFRGDVWGHNGPGVITRILNDVCKTRNTTEMSREKCNGFVVYPPPVVYPLLYYQWPYFFDSSKIDEFMKMIEGAYGVHIWNKKTSEIIIDTRKGEVPYLHLAKIHCSRVHANMGNEF